jgi:DNA repair exonuclease SbcCD ATPase subunit
MLLTLSKTALAGRDSGFWDIITSQVSEDEFKAFILYVQELEQENTSLNDKVSALEEALAETRQRVITLEEIVKTREREKKLLEEENLRLSQQVVEYKFLYENTRPSALDKAATIGLGAGVAAFLCFLVQIAD